MELRHLRYAVAVAEEGSFTRAAARLHVVQQALSQQIADLEHELGMRLFNRTPRGVVATEAGAVFIQEAIGTLARVERTVDRLRHHAPSSAPTLRVGAAPSFRATTTLIVEAVRRFHAAGPGVETDLVGLPPDLLSASVLAGRLDTAFTHAAPEPSMELDGRLVWEEPWTAVLLPARHSLATRHPLWLRELAGLPMISFPPEGNPVLHTRMLAALEERGLRPALAPIRLSGFSDAEAELIADGMGWRLMVPSARAQYRGIPGVAFRSFADDPIPRLGLWLLTRREEPSPLLARFLAAVETCRPLDAPAVSGTDAGRRLG